MTPCERILAAVELNPDRSRVTLRRDDVRQLIADNQRLTADVEHYKTGAIRLEAMCTEHCATIERMSFESDRQRQCLGDLTDHVVLMDLALDTLEHRPTWLGLWLSWAMLPVAAFAGALVHHG